MGQTVNKTETLKYNVSLNQVLRKATRVVQVIIIRYLTCQLRWTQYFDKINRSLLSPVMRNWQ